MNRALHIEDQVTIHGRASEVWEAIRDPATHAEWHPFLTRITGEHRVGAVRRCDVIVGKKSGHTEERCTGCEHERNITWLIEKDTTGFSRMVSDWTAGFSLEPQGSVAVLVKANSTFVPKNLLVRLTMPLIRRKFHQTQQIILNGLKQFIEAR
jgi:uncharacterized protein YndB with AHSA1/START domain